MAIEEDFCLLGLATDEPDYKLCWMINQALDFSFIRLDDLVLFHKRLNEDQYFPLFCYKDEDALVTYRVIANRSEQGFFLDELKNLDFLVHIQGEINTEKINLFLQEASKLSGVRMCIPVDLAKIRNMERLLLW